MALKILHVNDVGLNDPRIVNSALSAKKQGHHVYFCGGKIFSYLTSPIFEKTFNINWVHKKWLIVKWRSIRKQFVKVLEEINPDIIHAHDIFAAKMVSEFGYPFVLDDHEFYSLEFKASMNAYGDGLGRNIEFKLASWLTARWEKFVAEKAPVITVSQQIANEYRKITNKVSVVPNFPLEDAKMNPMAFNYANSTNLTSVYIGNDTEEKPHQFRNIVGLYDVFRNHDVGKLVRIGVAYPKEEKIESIGFVPLHEAYQTMYSCHVGLIPWKPHWFHKYCNPNKAYEYAHCGLYVMTTENLEEIISTFGEHCDTFKDYDELVEKLSYFKHNPEVLNKVRERTLDFAKKNLVWERHEHKILEAYKSC